MSGLLRWLFGASAKKRRRGRLSRPAGAQVVQLARGLGRKAAYRAASKKARRDFRGFSYNARTGRAVLT